MQNLQYFFSGNLALSPSKTIQLLQGELTLFKRSNSGNWQCRFKLANGQWHAASTNTEDLDVAQTQAIAIYEAVKVKVGAGLSAVTKTFKQVALDEIANMAQATHNKTGKRTYRDYAFAINKYLIPFFGQYEVSKITVDDAYIVALSRSLRIINNDFDATKLYSQARTSYQEWFRANKPNPDGTLWGISYSEYPIGLTFLIAQVKKNMPAGFAVPKYNSNWAPLASDLF